jgi:hypothetical protein
MTSHLKAGIVFGVFGATVLAEETSSETFTTKTPKKAE